MIPQRPISDAQRRALNLAVCTKLGLDPAIVGDDFRARLDMVAGDPRGRVTVELTAYLPEAEMYELLRIALGAEQVADAEQGMRPMRIDVEEPRS